MSKSRGRWVWHEVMSTDTAKVRSYYEGLFGWTGKEMDMGDGPYVMWSAGEQPVVGMMAAQGGAPSHWMSYVDVGDVDAAVAKVPKLGGEVVVPAFDIPSIGRTSMVKDPTGAMVAVFQGAEGGGDDRDWDAPPAPFSVCWTELMTHDVDKALGFYGELVGWTAEDMGPDMKVLKVGDKMVGSVRKMPEEAHGAPSHWLNYVLVPEVDAYQAKSEKLGATTLKGDTEIPGMGRFAIVQDPTGAVYTLWKQTAPPQ